MSNKPVAEPQNQNQEIEFISYDCLDFGTEEEPKCGICGNLEVDCNYQKGNLIEDTICDECSKKYTYCENADGYYLKKN